jgi:hypothetical protein
LASTHRRFSNVFASGRHDDFTGTAAPIGVAASVEVDHVLLSAGQTRLNGTQRCTVPPSVQDYELTVGLFRVDHRKVAAMYDNCSRGKHLDLEFFGLFVPSADTKWTFDWYFVWEFLKRDVPKCFTTTEAHTKIVRDQSQIPNSDLSRIDTFSSFRTRYPMSQVLEGEVTIVMHGLQKPFHSRHTHTAKN